MSALDPAFALKLLQRLLGSYPEPAGAKRKRCDAGDVSAANHGDEDLDDNSDGDVEERPDTPREQAGSLVWDMSCSPAEAAVLVGLRADEICAALLLQAAGDDGDGGSGGSGSGDGSGGGSGGGNGSDCQAVTPRLSELAAGIVANLAAHRTLRRRLRRSSVGVGGGGGGLVAAARACFLASGDAPTLRELARFFAALLRSGDGDGRYDAKGGSDGGDDGGGWQELRVGLATGVLAKACFVLHACADGGLLGRACQLLLSVSAAEPRLFASLARDRDCALGPGVAALVAERLNGRGGFDNDDDDDDDDDGGGGGGGGGGGCGGGVRLDSLESAAALPVVRLLTTVAGELADDGDEAEANGPASPPAPPLEAVPVPPRVLELLPALPALGRCVARGDRPPRLLAACAAALAAALLPAAAALPVGGRAQLLAVDAPLAAGLIDRVLLPAAAEASSDSSSDAAPAPGGGGGALAAEGVAAALALLDHQLRADEARGGARSEGRLSEVARCLRERGPRICAVLGLPPARATAAGGGGGGGGNDSEGPLRRLPFAVRVAFYAATP